MVFGYALPHSATLFYGNELLPAYRGRVAFPADRDATEG